MSSEIISNETLSYLRQRLENRSLGITHKIFPVRFNDYGSVCVTTDTIFIAQPTTIDEPSIKRLYGYQIHESAHIHFSSLDFEAVDRTVKENNLEADTAKDLLNIIEDYRVNALIQFSHKGAGRLMDSVHKDLCAELEPTDALQALLPALSGFKTKGKELPPEEITKLNKAIKLIKPVAKSLDISESLKVLPKVYKIFFNDNFFHKIPTILPNDIQPFVKKDAPTRDVKKNTKKAIEKSEQKVTEADEKRIEKEEADLKKDLERTIMETKKIQAESTKEIKKDMDELQGLSPDDFPVPDIQEGSKIVTLSITHKYIPTNQSDAEYHSIKTEYKHDIDTLLHEMKKLVVFDRRWDDNKQSGRLNSRKVYRILVNGNTKVFQRKSNEGGFGKLAVLLLIDNSGSMSGRLQKRGKLKIDYARDSAIILHEVLRQLKIKHMIVGFTADSTVEGSIDHFVFKTWNTTRISHNLLEMRPRHNNNDGGSIRTGIQYFKNIQERKRLMIIISDGQPACYYYRTTTESGEQDTVRSQHEAVKNGIKVINIGIGQGWRLNEGYLNKVKIDNPEELPKGFVRILRKELRA